MDDDGKKRLVHGTDVKARDTQWLWDCWCGKGLILLFAALSIAGIVYFAIERIIALVVICVLMLIIAIWGLYIETGLSSTYVLTEDGLRVRSVIGTENTSWDSVKGYGICPMSVLRHNPRPYIVLFLSSERYIFPMYYEQSNDPAYKMIALRYTEERLREIAEQMDMRGIPMDPGDERYPLEEIDDRDALY